MKVHGRIAGAIIVLGCLACGGGSTRGSDVSEDLDLGLVQPDGVGDDTPDADRDLGGTGDADAAPDTPPDVPPTCVPPADPWLQLPLDSLSNSAFPDASGNGHDATPSGAFGAIAGPRTSAVSLDGSTFLRVGSPATMPGGSAGTVALFFQAAAGPRTRVLFHRGDVLDLDRDGRLDMVLANNYDDTAGYATDSFVYFNHPAGIDLTPFRLPTNAASGIASADLDGDGWLDLVVAQKFVGLAAPNATNIYRGSAAGLVPDPDGALNDAAGGVAIADLDGDGWYDLVFGKAQDEPTSALVIRGSAAGFDRSRDVHLPAGALTDPRTGMPGGLTVADVNGDGLPDVVVSNIDGSVSRPSTSWIYTNAAEGFDATRRLGLTTHSAYGSTALDLDQDGYVDLVFGSYWDDKGTTDQTDDRYDVDSRIYRGSATGFTPDDFLALPSFGGIDPSAADLDDDGWPDLLMPNYFDGTKGADGRFTKPLDVPSRVYRGSAAGFHPDDRVELPANGCLGMAAADLDGDGWVDVLVPSTWDGSTHALDSHVYWGGPDGLDPARRTALPGRGTGAVGIPGSPFCAAGSTWGSQPCRHGSVRLSVADGRVALDLHDARGRPMRLDAPFTPGAWTHVAATWDADAGEARLAVDGVVVARKTAAFAMGATFPWRARVGSDIENLDRFTGGLADVQAFARALSDDEVACLAAGR
jgi:hypothetical protein